MKIAVATADGATVSQHFGQSRGFLVFTGEAGRIASRELKSAATTPHNKGVCSGQASRDGGIGSMLAGCEALICGGMGGGAAQAVIQLGVKPMVLAGVRDAEEAVTMYCEGGAEQAQAGYCNCKH